MKTSTTYHGFAMQYEELNKRIVEEVTKVELVERVYLLGLTTSNQRTESLFSVQSATRKEVTQYYLLILVETEMQRSLNSIQDKIEGSLQYFIPVTAIILTCKQFSDWLSEGHAFAYEVFNKSMLLYKKEDIDFPIPSIPDIDLIEKENAKLLSQTKIKVQEFLAGAELYTLRVQYKMAAFMLHQAVEQTLRTMLIINTGLRINTHSIDKLIRYSSMFYYELQDVFPRRTEKEKLLFQLLQKAYIDTRYKNDYSIKLEELNLLTNRIKKHFIL